MLDFGSDATLPHCFSAPTDQELGREDPIHVIMNPSPVIIPGLGKVPITPMPRPEDLINLSNNSCPENLPYPKTGSINAIIVLLVFTFLLVIGNLFLSWYLYKMGNSSTKHTNKLLKDVENAVWEVRKSCLAIKNSKAQFMPTNTKIEKKKDDDESENGDELDNKTTVIINNSHYLTSTPERKDAKMTRLSSTTTAFPENHDQALELMSSVIDQSFDRMIEKVDIIGLHKGV